MANTYTQCYLHIIFAPKNREALITRVFKNDLERYLTSIITYRKHKLLAINAQIDHLHILLGYNLQDAIPKLVEDLKTSSSKWINTNRFTPFKFDWQKGYSAFTHSKSQLDTVIRYVNNQDEHHRKRSFQEEYIEFLRKNDIEYNEKYIFEFFKKEG